MAKTKENPVEQPVIENPVETLVEPVEQGNENPKEPVEPVTGNPMETPIKPDENRVKVVVLKRFRDKYDQKTWYEVGDEPEFDEERAGDVIGRGLARLKE